MAKTKKRVAKASKSLAKGAKKATKASKDTTTQKQSNTGQPRGNGAKRASGLDAAVQVLGEASEPMSCKAIVEKMLAAGLWQSKGRTPSATISAAITREIANKGDTSRFRKVAPGRFTLNK